MWAFGRCVQNDTGVSPSSRHTMMVVKKMIPSLPALFILLACVSVFPSCVVHGFKPSTRLQMNVFGPKLILNLFERQSQWPKVKIPSDFILPEPRPLTITKSTDLGGFVTSSLVLALRLATGAFVLGWKVDTLFAPENDGRYALQLGPLRIRDSSSVLDGAITSRPTKRIVLFDNESCPRCKRVREMMNLLDLTYECIPCFGDNGLPRLLDPNNNGNDEISGDDNIITHLLEQYGPPTSSYDWKALWPVTFRTFALATSQLAITLRGNTGRLQQLNARPDNTKMKPIELWAYECSPFVRPVKEKLASLGLPHILVSCSRGSENRDRMVAKTGRFQVPYLVDANTGIEMFEGPEIVEYLEAVYTMQVI